MVTLKIEKVPSVTRGDILQTCRKVDGNHLYIVVEINNKKLLVNLNSGYFLSEVATFGEYHTADDFENIGRITRVKS